MIGQHAHLGLTTRQVLGPVDSYIVRGKYSSRKYGISGDGEPRWTLGIKVPCVYDEHLVSI